MARRAKKEKTRRLLWLSLSAVAVMALILTGVFLFMDAQTPPKPVYHPISTEPPRVSPYDPMDFVLDERGFMTCLTADYRVGIDVSSHQGDIDWQQVAEAGVEFVFIRVGRRGTTQGDIYPDELAQQYYEGAREAGLDIGAYFYSQAINTAEAEEEAWFVLKQIAHWQLELPVVYDWEWGGEDSRTTDLPASVLTQCNQSFCRIIEKAGLEAMIYFNEHQGLEQMDLDALEEYPFWLAMYDSPMDFLYEVDYWQYTQTGTVPGIAGNVDLNIHLPVAQETPPVSETGETPGEE